MADEDGLLDEVLRTRASEVPIASRGQLLRRSDAPRFTVYPNPHLQAFVERHRHREDRPTVGPFAGHLRHEDRSVIYSYHPYHTKVPPTVIAQLLAHYTRPGDLVLDVFAGSGMTGVAAQTTGRNAVLIDLAPAATFISSVATATHRWQLALEALQAAIAASERELGWMYKTTTGLSANYFVWCDVFNCPECRVEFPFFPHGVVHTGTKVETRDAFPCPACSTELNVRRVQRVVRDGRKQKQLVWVNAGRGRERINRAPTREEVDLAARCEAQAPASWYPENIIASVGYSAKLAQLGDKGITDVSRLLSRRNLAVFADLWSRLEAVEDARTRNLCLSALTSIFTVVSERQGYFGGGGGMSGNMYMPIVRMEKNVYDTLRRKLPKLAAAEKAKAAYQAEVCVSTQSATDLLSIADETIDFVYTDPPFGANIIYSEVNLALESWLGVLTNAEAEAVVDETRDRQLDDYKALMTSTFEECFRVLKPSRWMNVEFHNTSADVWQAIQESIERAGFEIGAVSTLDKGTTTILGDIRPNSAKHDLVIAAYKASSSPTERRQVAPVSLDSLRPVIETIVRDVLREQPTEAKHHVFSRLVAHHLEHGLPVNFSTKELYDFIGPMAEGTERSPLRSYSEDSLF